MANLKELEATLLEVQAKGILPKDLYILELIHYWEELFEKDFKDAYDNVGEFIEAEIESVDENEDLSRSIWEFYNDHFSA